jgi:tRNA1Val (adenine37-N6)-methyltransferase
MSRDNIFCFKRFTVDQSGCAMKVGTDGVLLGAWCRIDPLQTEAILDIGAGSGLIALQLAQRTEFLKTRIEAVEIDPAACKAARRNFEASPWANRLTLHPVAVQDFAVETTTKSTPDGRVKFDHVVSNPPFFIDSLASPDSSRSLARHTASLSYDELIAVCDRVLAPNGRISLIVPAGAETERMIAAAGARNFVATRYTHVHSTPKSGPKRTLIEFSRRASDETFAATAESITKNEPETTLLTIQEAGSGSFSPEYRALTREFYLYF